MPIRHWPTPIISKQALTESTLLGLLRYVGVRRSDVVKLGKPNECSATDDAGNPYEALRYRVVKGSERKPQPGKSTPAPKWLIVPILPELRQILEATQSGHLTYLVSTNWFRD